MGTLVNSQFQPWNSKWKPPSQGPTQGEFVHYATNLPPADYPQIAALWKKHYDIKDASTSVKQRFIAYLNDLTQFQVIAYPEKKVSGAGWPLWKLQSMAWKKSVRSRTEFRIYSYVPPPVPIIGSHRSPNPFFLITAKLVGTNHDYQQRLFLVSKVNNTWVYGGQIAGHAGRIVTRGDPGEANETDGPSDPSLEVLSDVKEDDEVVPADAEEALDDLFDDPASDPASDDPNNPGTGGNPSNPDGKPDSGDNTGPGGSGFPPTFPATKHVSPPNLSSGFGGIDASAAIFSINAFHTNLFDLDMGPGVETFSLVCPGPDSSTTTYTVPEYLNFTWATNNTRFSAVGSTKREFARDLSGHVKLDGNLLGFGAEFQRTFGDNSTEETFQKYMARYDQEYIYKVGFKDRDAAADHLTDYAQYALENWDAAKIVDTFGTHFTTEAYFGGLRIHSFISDSVDSFRKSELEWGLDVKVPIKTSETDAGKAHADVGEKDIKKNRLIKSMESMQTRTLGGTAPDSDNEISSWVRSLFTNPVVVNYALKPIYDLVPPTEPKYAALVNEVASRLAVSAPKDPFSLLAIRVPLKPYISDRDSRSKHDLTVAWPDAPDGWLRIGQFAQGVKWEDNTMGPNQGVAVRVNPNFSQEGKPPSVVSAVSCAAQWSNRRNGVDFGFFRPVGPQSSGTNAQTYEALGDFFENAQLPEGVPSVELESLAMFHTSLLKDAHTTDNHWVWLWDDTDTGGDKDVTVFGAPPDLAEVSPPKERRALLVGPGGGLAYLFKCEDRGMDNKKVAWKTLDWSKVKWLESRSL